MLPMEQTNLYQAFNQQVAKTPEALCLVGSRRLSYQAVSSEVNRYSAYLKQKGVAPHTVVALYGSKSIEAVITYLAIIKLGCTVLSLDTAFAASQISYTLTDADVAMVVCVGVDLPVSPNIPCLMVDEAKLPPSSEETDADFVANDIAWLVYSSGSTGQPKGITISHHTILSSYAWRYQISDYQPGYRVLCNIYFYWEVFRPLLRGGAVYVIDDNLLSDFDALYAFIEKEQINEYLMTPSYAEMFWGHMEKEGYPDFSSLSCCWLNGEVVSNSLSERLVPYYSTVKFYNLYSISETFDVACSLLNQQSPKDGSLTSIGPVFPAVSAVILDEDKLTPLANGEVGALYIGGDGLCQGYVNREDLNRSHFIAKESSPLGIRLFKTGDKAYIDETGEIVILGRIDNVVKLRGYNVSLLAIESVIKNHLPVTQCVVSASTQQGLQSTLTAFIETEDDEKFAKQYDLQARGTSSVLNELLSAHLPQYMLPHRYVLKHFKLNAYSAKLDRKSVVDDETPTIKSLWCEILGITECDESDSFYDLGGHSLLAISLLQRLKKQGLLELSMNAFNANPSLNGLALGETGNANDKSFLSEPAPTFSLDKLKPADGDNFGAVLLTGATGFLGTHLLYELLTETERELFCLVRAADNQVAKARVMKQLETYQLSVPEKSLGRLVVIAADISLPEFGLEPLTYQALAEQIAHIIHAAANVNLLLPYEKLKAANVTGVKEIIQFATNTCLKSVLMVSSDAVFPRSPKSFTESFLDKADASQLTDGYGQTKWVAESLFAANPGIPYTICRLGNLGPSTISGIANSDDANDRLFRFIVNTKRVSPSLSLELTPVDTIARLIVSMVQKNSSERRIVNLSNPERISGERLVNLLAETTKLIPADKWDTLVSKHEIALMSLIELSPFCLPPPYQLSTRYDGNNQLFPLPAQLSYLKRYFSQLSTELERKLHVTAN